MFSVTSYFVGFAIFILGVATVEATPLAAPSLFSQFVSSSNLAARSTSTEQQILKINQTVVNQLVNGELDAITLDFQGSAIVFKKTKYKRNKNTSSWIGNDDTNKNEIVLTFGKDHLFGQISGSGKTILFKPNNNPFETIQYSQDSTKEIPLVSDGREEPIALLNKSLQIPPAGGVNNDGSLIDVMVLYTDGMAAAHPGDAINTRIQYLIDLSNLAFTNSNINTQLRLIHSEEVNYADDSPGATSGEAMGVALDDLLLNNGVFSDVEYKKNLYGADQVTLLRRFVDEACGLAYVIINGGASYSYSIVHDGSKTDGSGYFCSDTTYIHELGHNLGSVHDRDHSSSSGYFDYSYGYQDPNNLFRTIMSYNCIGGCPTITHFSNPNINYQGNTTGIDELQNDSADNAKGINNRRVAMAGYKAEVEFNGILKRAELSKYVLQAKYTSSYVPPMALGNYNDVQSGDFNADWIEQLNTDGITEGCSISNFCPKASVTKAELAMILLKAKHGSSYMPPPATGTVFPDDVSIGSFSASWIEALSAQGISTGCATDKYCPNDTVNLEGFLGMLERTFY